MDGHFSRRAVMRGMVAGVPLAAILGDPIRTRAAAEQLQAVSITTAGGQKVNARLALPQTTPAPSVMLIHEWWGLNDNIKTMAAELAREGYIALAIDLYGKPPATTREEAKALMDAVNDEHATDTTASWIRWLKNHDKSTGKVGTIGWCFGGGWSLNASVAEPVDATVIYYGRVNRPVDQLKKLQGPVLGHFAMRDQYINAAMVDAFVDAMEQVDKDVTVYWYDADHAFANPTGGRYDQDDAIVAWERTLAFYEEHLRT